MAATSRIDRIRGTRLRIGYQDRRDDAHDIGVFVEGLTTGRDSLEEAISQAVTDSGLASPVDDKLPIDVADAYWLRTDAAFVALKYQRTASATPTRSAASMIESFGSPHSIEWYKQNTSQDAFGRPDGIVNLDMSALIMGRFVVRPWIWTFHAETIHMPAVLDTDPRETVRPWLSTINEVEETQFGRTDPPKTLLFADCQVRPIDTPAGIRYLVVYTLVRNRHQWVRQRPLGTVGVLQFVAQFEDRYEKETWGTVPVHTT